MDTISREHRSWNMSRIKSKDTSPERKVRSIIHSLGFRFRLHNRKLPGKPDIILPRLKAVIFVHGCFWHRHPECKLAYKPKSREEFWINKFEENTKRDKRTNQELMNLGWRVKVVWQCELSDINSLRYKLLVFLQEQEK